MLGFALIVSRLVSCQSVRRSKVKLWGEELGFRGAHLMSLLILFHISVPAVQKFLEKKNYFGLNLNSHCL